MEEKKYTIPIHNTTKVLYGSTKEFFRLFFMFLSPYHNLTTQELIVAAEIFRRKYELSKVILDGELLDAIVLNPENKKIIKEESGVTRANQFNVVLNRLKAAGVIQGNRMNPRFMPELNEEKGVFNMVFSFHRQEGYENHYLDSSLHQRRRGPNRSKEENPNEEVRQEDN